MIQNNKSSENMPLWSFTGKEKGKFSSSSPRRNLKAYFPLFNFAGLMSCATPELKGDIKTSHDTFLTPPLVTEDILHSLGSRNLWIRTEKDIWSATGCGWDTGERESNGLEKSKLEAGILYYTLSREHKKLKLKVDSTLFVPFTDDTVEVILFTITNTSHTKHIDLAPFFTMPLYARSADNQRDHRQVTTLLNRFIPDKNGVIVKPSMVFDEKGHRINEKVFSICGCTGTGLAPEEIRCVMEDLTGKNGSLARPAWIFEESASTQSQKNPPDGKEAVSAMRFKQITLAPGGKSHIIILAGISDSESEHKNWLKKYGTYEKAAKAFSHMKNTWQELLSKVEVETGDKLFDGWMKWVSLQPHARKVMGCSFLPDFGYGRGGRGWRDLWQDCLSLLLTVPEEAKEILINNFGGVRTDGSNATIIGSNPGEFLADRNNISRTFMDHGVWPLKTTSLYIEQTGDISLLLEKAPYFMDHHIFRGKRVNKDWKEANKSILKDKKGKIYKGSILEHILVQHVTSILNVGSHNICKLENADWNDGLDMAPDKGESVPFSCFYAGNLLLISRYLELLHEKGEKDISVFKELANLLKKMGDYEKLSWKKKTALLEEYMKKTCCSVSGEKAQLKTKPLSELLQKLSQTIQKTINRQEWISLGHSSGFYNGYYDNDGKKTDGYLEDKTFVMTLTGQVFPIMCGTAEKDRVSMVFQAAKKYLQDPRLKGFRLNTKFDGPRMKLGRAYGFAYGTKENGAFFSHMNVMFMNSLYQRGFVRFGFEVLDSISRMSTDSATSDIYPGLPEYFDLTGRGAYLYLTGSASWMVLTILTQVFGIKGEMGDLVIEPKLVKEQFQGKGSSCTARCSFAGKNLTVIYRNPSKKDYGAYTVKKITCKELPFENQSSRVIIRRKDLTSCKTKDLTIQIHLG